MDCQTARHTLRVTNSQGFHMRPCAAFAALATRFQSDVKVTREDRVANGKSPLELMILAAPQGSELTVELTGPDSRDALTALLGLWETFAEKEAEGLPNKP